jgi:hypothetical protein
MSDPDYEFVVESAGCAANHEKPQAEIHFVTKGGERVRLEIDAAALVVLPDQIARELKQICRKPLPLRLAPRPVVECQQST